MARGLNGKEYLDSVLDENEQAQVRQFVMNEPMREAVRKALLAVFYQQGTITKGKKADVLSNVAFGLLFGQDRESVTNERLGANLRALWEGINQVEISFENLLGYAEQIKEESPEENPAR